MKALTNDSQSVEVDLKILWSKHLGGEKSKNLVFRTNRRLGTTKGYIGIPKVTPSKQFEKILGKNACKYGLFHAGFFL